MKHDLVVLDPNDLDSSTQQFAEAYDLDPDLLAPIRRVVALYPRPARVYIDEARQLLYQNLALADKFSFNLETDDLILFTHEPEALLDALIEMAMYLAGFATMMGNEEEWVVEFAVGAWRPVKNRIKRQLDLSVSDHPRGVVGLPPAPGKTTDDDPYPFKALVSTYDLASFYQMVMLAAHDDIAVYFPPETHPKVLAVYVYMRRAMHEVAQGLEIKDYQEFNARLLQAIQQMQTLFDPASLPPPGQRRSKPSTGQPRQLGFFPSVPKDVPYRKPRSDDPFEEFIDQLFPDDGPDLI